MFDNRSNKQSSSNETEIVTDLIANTIAENGKIIESDQLSVFCKRAFELEKKIYHRDPVTYGITEFKKTFLAMNKLQFHPDGNPLPFNPEDIRIFNNGIFIFKDGDDNKDVGYFTALCFFKKHGDSIESIHIRFLAGVDENYRGMGFHYAPLFRHVFSVLKEFSEKYPGQNPTINITQFAMVSPGTPGAITNFASILSGFLPGVAEFKYGDKEAINMAVMFGLRELLDPSTGKANINMKIQVATFFTNKNNKRAHTYDSLNLKEGEGVVGRQELGKLKDLLNLKDAIEPALRDFSDKKSAKVQDQSRRAKL